MSRRSKVTARMEKNLREVVKLEGLQSSAQPFNPQRTVAARAVEWACFRIGQNWREANLVKAQ